MTMTMTSSTSSRPEQTNVASFPAAGGADGDHRGLRRVEPVHARGDAAPDLQLALVQALQTTLDPAVLVEIFASRIAGLVGQSGLDFASPGCQLLARSGREGAHRLGYQLCLHGETLGRVELWRDRPFSERECGIVEGLVAALLQPLRNAILYQRALRAAARDPLTGVLNRLRLDFDLAREVSVARRCGASLSLLMLDVDHFKRVNDAHGHPAGDRVLRAIARCIQGCVRDGDAVYRYGGEEFCVVAPRTSLDGGACLAERLRKSVAGLRVALDGVTVCPTVSVGVATLAGNDPDELLEQADRALYSAKGAGRDRVAVDDPVDAAAAPAGRFEHEYRTPA